MRFRDIVSNFKKLKLKIKNFKIKKTILVIFFLESYFCNKNWKRLFERIVLLRIILEQLVGLSKHILNIKLLVYSALYNNFFSTIRFFVCQVLSVVYSAILLEIYSAMKRMLKLYFSYIFTHILYLSLKMFFFCQRLKIIIQ